MFKVKGIVPGCVVNYCPKGGVREEARVLALAGKGTVILVLKDLRVRKAPLDHCELKYAVVGNSFYNLRGECLGKI